MAVFGAIEAGGTKFNCLVGSGPGEIQAEARIPTTTPDETFSRVIQFFMEQSRSSSLESIGVGSFGPVDLYPSSPTYGYITTTVKPGWKMADFVGTLKHALRVPIAFDTDVNAAAFGEYTWGAAMGLTQFAYMTIGTGIGVGEMCDGKLVHGLVHPEGGHILIPHDWNRDPFPGVCHFHGDCFEGLASGPSLQARWGIPAEEIPSDSPGWPLEASYIALAISNQVCTLSPQRIILGGGVMEQTVLFPLIRSEVQRLLNGYIQSPQILDQIDAYIVPPGLGTRAGVLGALAMAMRSAQ